MLTVSTETITTFSGSVCVCSTSARNASGVVSLFRHRNTATPGVLISDGRVAASPSRNASNGPSWASRLRVTIICPRRQLIITTERTRPIASGSHAPCAIFAILALKNAISTVRNSATTGASLRLGVPQISRATAMNSSVLRMKVPVTATP